MRRKIFFVITCFLLLCSLFPSSLAEETAGVSPDNPILWHLEVFMEKFSIAITSSSSVKVEKSLNAAEERVAEFDKMLRWKKTEEANKAKEAHEMLMDKIIETIIDLEKKNTEKEFEEILTIEADIQEYGTTVSAVISAISTEDIDDEQKTLLTEFMEKEETNIQKIVSEAATKKAAIILKLKASGLTDTEIATLEQNWKTGTSETTDVTGAVTAITETIPSAVSDSVSKTVDAVAETQAGQIVDSIAETITENVDVTESVEKAVDVVETVSTVVTDTTASSKVKIDGDVTAEQLQRINILYEQLRAESTDAEIELTVSKMDNGLWKIEKEIDGILTSLQQEQLDDLILTLSSEPSTVKIKVKYDPGDISTSNGVVVGESESGLETAFVIG